MRDRAPQGAGGQGLQGLHGPRYCGCSSKAWSWRLYRTPPGTACSQDNITKEQGAPRSPLKAPRGTPAEQASRPRCSLRLGKVQAPFTGGCTRHPQPSPAFTASALPLNAGLK